MWNEAYLGGTIHKFEDTWRESKTYTIVSFSCKKDMIYLDLVLK